jgi:hypothetical protein
MVGVVLASEGGSSGDDEDGDDTAILEETAGDSKRSTQFIVKLMNEQAHGDLSLAQEHFNDNIEDTEPLSEEKATMVDRLLQSYGYTLPSYQFAPKAL